jgi:membrane protease YdiL (CAAX protease family)
MNIDYCLQPGQNEALWAISIVTVSFVLYWFIVKSEKFNQWALAFYGKKRGRVNVIVIQRLIGVFFFGVLPVLAVLFVFQRPFSQYGLNLDNIPANLMWIGILSPVVVLLNYINARKPGNLEMYPQIRKKKWTRGLVVLSAVSWTAYLVAYEYMFRSFLLFSCYYAFGATMAIVINTSLYSLTHVPKGFKEAIGAIPLGIILCILTLKTGNIWIAFIVHVVMALSNEWLSLWAHPEMKIVKKK